MEGDEILTVTFHADDYGINDKQSQRVLVCSEQNGGVLNSVSIMPNSRNLDSTIPMLDSRIKTGIHINLAEGTPCADPRDIPLLVRNGVFYHSFMSLLWLSITKRRQLEHQVEAEILAQINSVVRYLDTGYKVRIDSHVHYHMIPVVFKGLCKALKRSGHEVEYIRYTNEKLSLYLWSPYVWRYIHTINIIKALLLKIFGIINRGTLRQYGYEACIGLFFGVVFTGEMYGKHIGVILEKYCTYARKHGQNLEVLFHPGAIAEGEEFLKGCNTAFKAVYSSKNRSKEAKVLKKLGGINIS